MSINLNNIQSDKRLELIPGINVVTITNLTLHKEFKTKKGIVPCLEVEFQKVKTPQDNEDRFLTDKIFPHFQHRVLNTKNNANKVCFEILVGKLMHIFGKVATIPAIDIEEGEEAYFATMEHIYNAVVNTENYKEIKLNLIACYSGRYLTIPNSVTKNFCEVYVAGKPTTLVLDVNLHPLTAEIVEKTNLNSGGGISLADIPV
jgi:hypothetical protein